MIESSHVASAEPRRTDLSSLARQFISGTIWATASQRVTHILSLAASIILARLLAPDDFGTFAFALSILSFFYILISWNFTVAVIQVEEMDQNFFDTAWVLTLALGCGVFVLIAAISFFLKHFYAAQVIKIIVILSLFRVPSLLSVCYAATLERELNYGKVALVDMASQTVAMATAIDLAVMYFGVWSLVGKQAVLALGRMSGMRAVSPWRFKGHFDTHAAKHLLSFGGQMFVSGGLESFISQFRNFIMGTLLGTTALGYFDRGMVLVLMGRIITSGQLALAAYSRLQASEDKRARAFEMISYVLIRGSMLITVVLLLFGGDITVLLYGEKWATSGQIVQILSVCVLLTFVFGNGRVLLYAQGRVKEVSKVRVVQSLLLVLVMPVALARYGVFGAAVVVDFLYLVGTVLTLLYVKSCTDFRLTKLLLPPVLAGVLALCLGIAGSMYLETVSAPIARLLLGITLLALAYLGGLCLLERKQMQQYVRYLSKYAREASG